MLQSRFGVDRAMLLIGVTFWVILGVSSKRLDVRFFGPQGQRGGALDMLERLCSLTLLCRDRAAERFGRDSVRGCYGGIVWVIGEIGV